MYFKKSGKINTEETVKLAVKTAKERNINYIVVATSKGGVPTYLKDCGINVVVVTHANGYPETGVQELPEEKRKEFEEYRFTIYTSSHVLSGAERGLSKQFGGVMPVEIIANSLRMLGQGVKVGVEISTMALDGGVIPYGEDIIAISGSGRGADTALIIRPAHASEILKTKIREIICKPMEW
ncbi:hypothetical protein OSC52_16775 [Clostridium pasteurianum]|uniref:pyruvate kinase alpha/beta domain-containing protein n=1 Tax=Clostridium pasteurianum TaxID=1501 RepID=UPI002260A7DD|nr:pyruvate kinase alpha/beta domain-containing protein [Clostridium pasteurianum]UZW13477.1 hypothetical protein OSC52_16775 [Clostridium pasteurianum]